MARLIFTFVCLTALSSCVIPRTVDRLQDRNPPPDFGRPEWVQASAGAGAWVGAVLGGVVSIALLPVTYPLSVLAEDDLGEAGSEELMFFPAIGGAATGQFLFGAPPDLVDFLFRRAWMSNPPPPNTYDLVPMESPSLPQLEEIGEPPPEEPIKTPSETGQSS